MPRNRNLLYLSLLGACTSVATFLAWLKPFFFTGVGLLSKLQGKSKTKRKELGSPFEQLGKQPLPRHMRVFYLLSFAANLEPTCMV